ncbi:SDR family NAD(P)-dependent oxidoreductase [Jatrophihabitans sp. DSM 45814]
MAFGWLLIWVVARVPAVDRVLAVARYLITGVSRGIGRAVADELISRGHDVIGLVRTAESAELVSQRGLRKVLVADLAHPESLSGSIGAELAELTATSAELGSATDGPVSDTDGPVSDTGLAGLVHAAGIVRPGSLASSGPAEFADQFAVNVTAVAELTRLALPALRAAGGTLVLVNSGSGLNVRPPLSTYGISKHAMRAYADALRQEEPSIRVSTVFPGRTATDMQRAVRHAENGRYDEAAYLSPATVAGVICSVLFLPEDGVITDVTVRPATQPGPSAPSPDAVP